MKPESLCIAYAKTKRTETQIDNLDSRINTFLEANPYKMVANLNPERTEKIWKYEVEKIPVEIQILTGEILHNLRSPLDQVCCEIAVRHGGSENDVSFPVGRDAHAFEAAIRKQNTLSEAHDIIRKAEPYSGGKGHLVWAAHELNRRDKHRIGLMSINLHTLVYTKDLKVFDAPLIRLGSRHGRHFLCNLHAPPGQRHLYQADPARKPIYRLRDGVPWTEFGPLAENPIYDDMEIMTTAPGARVEIDAKPTLSIAFSKVGVDGQPITAVLHDMRDLVERILLTFEKRFFS